MLELALMLLPLRAQGTALEQRADLVLPFELADHRIIELGGLPGAEVVLVGRRGELRSWNLGAVQLKGSLQLSTPARTLLSYARVSSDEPHERVFVLDERGVRAQRTDAEGVILEAHDELSKRVRWTLRNGVPRFVDFAPDLNQDGSAELVAPRGNRMEIWRRMPQTGSATEQYDRIAAVEITARRSRSTNASIASA
ncbi:MAG: hypothetical protein ACKO32_09610, partial [Planctomycetia bacterium]